MIMTPEPSPVSGPSSATPNVKMLGNMIELKNPTRMMVYIAVCPVVSIEIATSAAALTVQMPSNSPVLATKWPPLRAVAIARIAATTATRAKSGRAATKIETIAHRTAVKLKWPEGAARLAAQVRATHAEMRNRTTPQTEARAM